MWAKRIMVLPYDGRVMFKHYYQVMNNRPGRQKRPGFLFLNVALQEAQKRRYKMKLMIVVFMIRFLMTFIDNKSKKNKTNELDANDSNARHPAEFRVR